MKKLLLDRICNLKVKEVQAKLNFRRDEQKFYAQELKNAFMRLNIKDVKEIREESKKRLSYTQDMIAKTKNITQKCKEKEIPATTLDAKHFYTLSSKEIAYENLILECDAILTKLDNNDLQF